MSTRLGLFLALASLSLAAESRLNVLFIGNSYTGRHALSEVVKTLAEEGQPGLSFQVTTVIYGGRTLKDHWRLGTQNFVKLARLTVAEEQATIQSLRETVAKDAKDTYAAGALKRHEDLVKTLGRERPRWDVVVLQSYRDDLSAGQPYYEYAPKFVAAVRAEGARAVLYETTPTTQNAQPLTSAPDFAPIAAKERAIAALAARTGAAVVPMAMVGWHCQSVRPDLPLRFVNDGHLNQTMAYLTACTFYGVLFDRSPEGLKLDRVTDTRYLDNQHRDLDRDSLPLTRTFSARDRADLQRIAWEGLQKYRALPAAHP